MNINKKAQRKVTAHSVWIAENLCAYIYYE